jgi:hypothetical protein
VLRLGGIVELDTPSMMDMPSFGQSAAPTPSPTVSSDPFEKASSSPQGTANATPLSPLVRSRTPGSPILNPRVTEALNSMSEPELQQLFNMLSNPAQYGMSNESEYVIPSQPNLPGGTASPFPPSGNTAPVYNPGAMADSKPSFNNQAIDNNWTSLDNIHNQVNGVNDNIESIINQLGLDQYGLNSVTDGLGISQQPNYGGVSANTNDGMFANHRGLRSTTSTTGSHVHLGGTGSFPPAYPNYSGVAPYPGTASFSTGMAQPQNTYNFFDSYPQSAPYHQSSEYPPSAFFEGSGNTVCGEDENMEVDGMQVDGRGLSLPLQSERLLKRHSDVIIVGTSEPARNVTGKP